MNFLTQTQGNKFMSQEMMSAEIAEIAKALSKAQGEMLTAKESSNNPFFKSKYADYNAVRDAVIGPLTRNGLSWTHLTQKIDGNDCLITILMHSSGQWLKSIFPFPTTKGDAQSQGSAITYLKRYSLSAITGCACGSGEDDDGEKSMSYHREKKPTKVEFTDFQCTIEDLHKKCGVGTLDEVKEYVKFIAIAAKDSEESVVNSIFAKDRVEEFKSKLIARIESKLSSSR